MQTNSVQDVTINNQNGRSNGKKILFACVPGDGHFNPLTSLAKNLQSLGYDVRWYSSVSYEEKLKKLDIPFFPFKQAMEVTGATVDQLLPERENITSPIKKLNFDMINFFILRGPEYYTDMMEIHKTFPFELLIADCCFSGIPFVADKMKLPVIAVGVLPLTESSRDLAPTGLGITPSKNIVGRTRQAILRYMADNILFRKANKVMRTMLDSYGILHKNLGMFDLLARKSTLLLQSGTPGFEYYRSDLGENVRFIGSVLPFSANKKHDLWFDERLNKHERIVIVTQGTVEKNPEKIIVPTLEAFRNTDTLVVATTGGSQTADLRQRYPDENFIIEDFISFDDIMPYADVYITNGGYGGVMLGIENRLPLVVAGIHEGKNEINARIGYFNLGINLKTETPRPEDIRAAAEGVFTDPVYKQNVHKLADEFSEYNAADLCANYVKEVLQTPAKSTKMDFHPATNN